MDLQRNNQFWVIFTKPIDWIRRKVGPWRLKYRFKRREKDIIDYYERLHREERRKEDQDRRSKQSQHTRDFIERRKRSRRFDDS